MLMKTRVQPIDFHSVKNGHESIHKRLENWARYVAVRNPHWVGPIWKLGKSNGRQWHAPEVRPQVDELDGLRVEKAVAALPDKHRKAIRWAYITKEGPAKKARELAVSYDGLFELLNVGRTMLKNTCTQIDTAVYNRAQFDRADA